MSGSKRPRSRKRRVAAIGLGLVVVVLALGSGGFVFAAHLEENDAFCASCHSQPESTYFDRTQAAGPVDLASSHHAKSQPVTCIDCHAGPGLAGRLAAMTIGAGDLFHYVTNTAKQPAPLTVPIGDVNCLKCHADVAQTRDFNQHFHAFLSRWQALDKNAATCVDCHTAHNTDGEAGLMFLQRDHTLSICQNCHNRIGGG